MNVSSLIVGFDFKGVSFKYGISALSNTLNYCFINAGFIG